MNASVRWVIRNLVWLLLVIVPVIVLLMATSTAVAGYDRTALSPGRLVGDLAALYPTLAVPLALGGLVQSLLTLAGIRLGLRRNRLVAIVLAPVAFAPLVLFRFVDVGAMYMVLPLVLACVLYAALLTSPPISAAV